MMKDKNFWFLLVLLGLAVAVVANLYVEDEDCRQAGGVLVRGADGRYRCVRELDTQHRSRP